MQKTALCSILLPKVIREHIEKLFGLKCIALPPFSALPNPVEHHPDMLIFNPPNQCRAIISSGYHAVNPEFFGQFNGSSLILSDVSLGKKYPEDIALDALGINDTVYCLALHTAEEVKKQFSRTVNIKQGYAACSTLVLNESAAITADRSVANALRADGIRVLEISPEGIALPGYDCGFIGGASAVINDTVVFFGNACDHPDGERITEFCYNNGFKTLDFPQLPLTDYGSIRYLYN